MKEAIMKVIDKLEESVLNEFQQTADVQRTIEEFEKNYVNLINNARKNGASRMDIIRILDKYIDKF